MMVHTLVNITKL